MALSAEFSFRYEVLQLNARLGLGLEVRRGALLGSEAGNWIFSPLQEMMLSDLGEAFLGMGTEQMLLFLPGAQGSPWPTSSPCFPRHKGQTTQSRHKSRERLEVEFSGFAWGAEFPGLVPEGILFFMLAGFVSYPMLLRRKNQMLTGKHIDHKNMERKHIDHKNFLIHSQPSRQGKAKQEKEAWAQERELQSEAQGFQTVCLAFHTPWNTAHTPQRNGFAGKALLRMWNSWRGDIMSLCLAHTGVTNLSWGLSSSWKAKSLGDSTAHDLSSLLHLWLSKILNRHFSWVSCVQEALQKPVWGGY